MLGVRRPMRSHRTPLHGSVGLRRYDAERGSPHSLCFPSKAPMQGFDGGRKFGTPAALAPVLWAHQDRFVMGTEALRRPPKSLIAADEQTVVRQTRGSHYSARKANWAEAAPQAGCHYGHALLAARPDSCCDPRCVPDSRCPRFVLRPRFVLPWERVLGRAA